MLTREGNAVAERINRLIRDLEGRIGNHVGTRELAGFRSVMGAVAAATDHAGQLGVLRHIAGKKGAIP